MLKSNQVEEKKYSPEHIQYLKYMKRKNTMVQLSQIALLVLILFLWELSANLNWIDPFFISKPSAIMNLINQFIKDGSLLLHTSISVYEVLMGFVIGTILGTLIAILLWSSEFAAKVLYPYLVVLNALPKIALGPIIIIWAGAGTSGIIVTALSISLIVTIMATFNGFKEVDEEKIKMLQTFGANKFQILQKVVLPATIPTMINTMKINIGMSWVGVIVGEFLVSKAGLGYLIVYGGQVFRLDIVMAGVIVLSIATVIMYKLISILENTLLKWRQ
ncbi:MAG: ABC transporter permease [Clostridiales bacterium]|nr:ABC transporter permease [Clostridiales bacterium]